jgi:hypothetical protein
MPQISVRTAAYPVHNDSSSEVTLDLASEVVSQVSPIRRPRMKIKMEVVRHSLLASLVVTSFVVSGFSQKIKIGYNKGADFSKYKSYTWAKPGKPPARPLLYQLVVMTIDNELASRGLQKAETGGDLNLIADGGIEYGSNMPAGTPVLSIYGGAPPSLNATMWVGGDVTWAASTTNVQEGTLIVEFVDRSHNEALWIGTVKQNIDSQNKKKSIALVQKGITKLLKDFPPKGSSK